MSFIGETGEVEFINYLVFTDGEHCMQTSQRGAF